MDILVPSMKSKVDYFNRKQKYSINSLIFLDISKGYPKSVHDSRVFDNSAVYTKTEEMEILNDLLFTIEHKQIRL